MAERNLDWIQSPIPEDCKAIVVCVDAELFDELVSVGLVPLIDDRKVNLSGLLDPGYRAADR